MAFETLGINLVVKGMSTVARDVSHVATSFNRFINVANRAQKSVLKFAQTQEKMATSLVGKTQSSIDRLITKYAALSDKSAALSQKIGILGVKQAEYHKILSAYPAMINAVKNKQNELIAAVTRYNSFADKRTVAAREERANVIKLVKELDMQRAALNVLTPEYIKASNAVQRYINYQQDYIDTSEEVVSVIQQITGLNQEQVQNILKQKDAQDALNKILGQSKGPMSGLSAALGTLTKGYGQNITANSGMLKLLGLTSPQLAAVSVGLDLMKLAMNGVVLVTKIFIGAFKLVWGILKKVLSVVWDVVKWVGEKLWNAFKKVLALPFNIIKKAFEGIGNVIRQALGWLVGMNIDRIIWGITAKLRELSKVAIDAAMEYQITFIRLRGLMTGEVMNQTGLNYADSLAQATTRAKDLVTWVSKLAVLTIFDADDILNVTTLAMAYGFTSDNAKELTESVLDFATGMGLEDVAMRRIIENFGQLRAQGKITGTELRDLARGSFVPVNDVLEQMAKNVGLVGDYDIPNLTEINEVFADMTENGEISKTAYEAINKIIANLGKDGKITRVEFETLTEELSKSDVMKKFGLSAEQADKALEGIKTGKLTAELNELIKTGKIGIDEFFDAFIDMTENRFPNAAASMSASMKTVVSNLGDFIKTMIGWRLLAPVFEVIAENLSATISKWMSDKNIALFDKFGLAFRKVTKLAFGFGEAFSKSLKKVFGATGFGKKVQLTLGAIAQQLGYLGLSKKAFETKFLSSTFVPFLDLLSGAGALKVVKGLSLLNDVFLQLTSGEDVDIRNIIDQLKTATTDIAKPIWEEILKPELEKVWKNIKTFIVDKWINDIVPAFQTWKADKFMPWLDTFINVTIPALASTLASSGLIIVDWLNNKITNALGNLHNKAIELTGESSPLSLLLGLFESLSKFIGLKLPSEITKAPTSSIPGAGYQGPGAGGLPDFSVIGDPFEISGLAGALDDITTSLNSLLIKALTPFGEWLSKNEIGIENVTQFAEALWRLATVDANALIGVGEGISSIGNAIIGIFDKTGDKDQGNLFTFIQNMSELITSLSGLSKSLVALPKAALGDALKQLGDGITAFMETLSTLWYKFYTGQGFDFIEDFKPVVEFGQSLAGMGNWSNLREAGENFKYFWDMLTQPNVDQETWLDDFQEFLQDPFGKNGGENAESNDDVRNMGASIIKGVSGGMEGEQQTIIDTFSGIIAGISGERTSANGRSRGGGSNYETLLAPVGEQIMQGLYNGLQAKWREIEAWWVGIAIKLQQMWSLMWDLHSPSRVMFKMGENLAEGLKRGIVKGMKSTTLSVRMQALDIQQAIGALKASDIERNYYSTVTSSYNFNVTSHSSVQTLIQQYEVLRAMAG